MFCTKCGKKILENAKFCQFCGTSTNTTSIQNKTKTIREKTKDNNYIWAYRFTDTEIKNLSVARHYIEQKGDYIPIKTELNRKNIFVYQKGKGKKAAVVILYKQGSQIIIFGNENGYTMVRSRYLKENFKNVKKEKVIHDEIKSKDILRLIDEFNIKKGDEFDGLVGVGGWLTYFIIGIVLSIILILIYAFTPPITL